MAASCPQSPELTNRCAQSNSPHRALNDLIGVEHASLLTALRRGGSGACQSGCQAPGTPTVAAGGDRRVGHVLRLALVAYRRSDGGNSNLAVATIKALHLRLGLRWGLSACWHWGPLVDGKDAV